MIIAILSHFEVIHPTLTYTQDEVADGINVGTRLLLACSVPPVAICTAAAVIPFVTALASVAELLGVHRDAVRGHCTPQVLRLHGSWEGVLGGG